MGKGEASAQGDLGVNQLERLRRNYRVAKISLHSIHLLVLIR